MPAKLKRGRPPHNIDKPHAGQRHAAAARRAMQVTLDRVRALQENALSEEDFRASCRANAEDIAALQDIITSKKPVRNAASIVKAIETKWAYGHGKPKGSDEPTAGTTVNMTFVKMAQQIMALPTEVLEAYARTGQLPEGAWIPGYRDRVEALEKQKTPPGDGGA